MSKIPKRTYFNWSSGKDSAFALFKFQQKKDYTIDLLVTSINSHHNRVSMHGLRREVLLEQTKLIGLPLQLIELPEKPSMKIYENVLTKTVEGLQDRGYTDCVFGDIFLEDLRAYREKQLNSFNIISHFPLWKIDTKILLNDFLKEGFKTIVIAINASLLDVCFLGRIIDEKFINDLPEGVDPCGENGEFHTFCFDGPIFNKPVDFKIGEKVYQSYPNPDKTKKDVGFWFLDLTLN